jgi:hypothetical protein
MGCGMPSQRFFLSNSQRIQVQYAYYRFLLSLLAMISPTRVFNGSLIFAPADGSTAMKKYAICAGLSHSLLTVYHIAFQFVFPIHWPRSDHIREFEAWPFFSNDIRLSYD